MYIVDGICYASKETDEIEIISVKPLEDRMILIQFLNGEIRLFDTNLLQGPVFEALKDENIFNDVKIVNGVVTWMDGDIDCAPEYMYENSFEYNGIVEFD